MEERTPLITRERERKSERANDRNKTKRDKTSEGGKMC
jgi:hypothetical protein